MEPAEQRGVTGAYAGYLTLQRTREQNAGWQLLRADNAPLIASILGRRLAGEARRRPSVDLVELVEADLDELRSFGVELPQRAQKYVADWRSNGYLVARPTQESRGETLELSPGGLAAIRTLNELVTPRQAVTESRLAAVAQQLSQLAADSDPEQAGRLERLHAERERIDREIAKVSAGDYEPLDSRRAAERFRDIVAMAEEIPSDFAKVRVSFERLNQLLREQILDSDASQRHVLDEIFRGVDLIDESDEGRSFQQFLALLLDPESGATFDSDVDHILDRSFVRHLSPSERRYLRRFRALLKTEGADIDRVVSGFVRGLHGYVQSQQYQRDRELRRLLREALSEGLRAAAHIKPFRDTRAVLELTGVKLSSAGQLSLHDPAAMNAGEELVEAQGLATSYEELRAITRETEIDFGELQRAVEATLREVNPASIGQVLERHPATQGVASVVGLMALAIDEQGVGVVRKHGVAAPLPATEIVSWADLAGFQQQAVIELYEFARSEATRRAPQGGRP